MRTTESSHLLKPREETQLTTSGAAYRASAAAQERRLQDKEKNIRVVWLCEDVEGDKAPIGGRG